MNFDSIELLFCKFFLCFVLDKIFLHTHKTFSIWDESTLQKGQDCCHIQGSHIWTSTMSLLWKIFTMFLHIMVGQNPKKSNARGITHFYFIWCDVRIYLCQKHICWNVLKNANIFKDWNDFVFVKFIIPTKHCDSI